MKAWFARLILKLLPALGNAPESNRTPITHKHRVDPTYKAIQHILDHFTENPGTRLKRKYYNFSYPETGKDDGCRCAMSCLLYPTMRHAIADLSANSAGIIHVRNETKLAQFWKVGIGNPNFADMAIIQGLNDSTEDDETFLKKLESLLNGEEITTRDGGNFRLQIAREEAISWGNSGILCEYFAEGDKELVRS